MGKGQEVMRYEIAIKFDNVDELIGAVKILRDAGAVTTVVERIEAKSAQVSTAPIVIKPIPESTGPSDPWADDSFAEATPARVPSANPSQSASTIVDKFDNQWILNSPGAPSCECGIPAGKIKGTSRAGKPYTAWRCSKAVGAGDAWKSKCDYSAPVR